MLHKKIVMLGAVTALVAGATAFAATNKSPQETAVDDTPVIVFSAPPREPYEVGREIYQPIVEYLSRVTGKRVVYRQPGNWLTYQTEMLKGGYDLVFDGPHFNSWRMAHQQHNALVRYADDHIFAVIVRKDNVHINDLKQLAGKKVCGLNPPNLGTLAVLGEFDNPARQPVILETLGWEKAYQGVVMENRCVAGIVPVANLNKYDKPGNFSKIVYRTRAMPNQSFSAGPRVTREDQAKIAQALVAPEATAATAKLRASYGFEKALTRAAREEYAGLDAYLKDVWGYAR